VEAALIRNRDLLVTADRQVRLVMPQEVEKKIELDFHVLRDRSLLNLQTGLPVANQVNGLLVHMDFNAGVGLVVVMGIGLLVFANTLFYLHFFLHCESDRRLLQCNQRGIIA
jgi:hypothetical protein